ncbi:MAG: homoprotocatechuate degradation operon regulator HpaR [Gammaproteobacteria bacterium]
MGTSLAKQRVSKGVPRAAGPARTAQRESPPIRTFSRSLPMALLKAREAVMRPFRASLRKHNLTEQQWRVLRALDSVEEIKMTDLARQTFLHGPSLTRILRDLFARGLISRRTPAADLRFGLISISKEGLRVIRAHAPESEAIYAEITRRIGEQELTRIEEILTRLERELSKEKIEP